MALRLKVAKIPPARAVFRFWPNKNGRIYFVTGEVVKVVYDARLNSVGEKDVAWRAAALT